MESVLKQVVVYHVIILAIILSFHFYTAKKRNLSNTFLAYLLFSYVLSITAFRVLLEFYIPSFAIQKIVYTLHIIFKNGMFVFLLFYIKSLHQKYAHLDNRTLLSHSLPLLALFIILQFLLSSIPSIRQEDVNNYINVTLLNIFYYGVYLVFVGLYLSNYYKPFKLFFSKEKNPYKTWLIGLLSIFFLLWASEIVVLLILYSDNVYQFFPVMVNIYTFLPFIFVNTILFFALRNPSIFTYRRPTMHALKPDDQENLLIQFKALMNEEKIFKEPDITLAKTAERLNLKPKYLSQFLNEQLNSTFPDIINEYRINESKNLLKNYPEMTIQQIMFEVGYNSKSAFNHHFKNHTGQTPSTFRSLITHE